MRGFVFCFYFLPSFFFVFLFFVYNDEDASGFSRLTEDFFFLSLFSSCAHFLSFSPETIDFAIKDFFHSLLWPRFVSFLSVLFFPFRNLGECETMLNAEVF